MPSPHKYFCFLLLIILCILLQSNFELSSTLNVMPFLEYIRNETTESQQLVNKSNRSQAHVVHKEVQSVTDTQNFESSPISYEMLLLEKTRQGIMEEMAKAQQWLKRKNWNEKLVMEKGGDPIRAMIVSTWRSGTTFLGDLLQTHPATFYHCEPLNHFRIQQARGGRMAEEAIRVIRSLFDCNYHHLESYLSYAKSHLDPPSRNVRLWTHCNRGKESLCFQPDFLSRMCKMFPFQAMKTVRLRLNLTRELLEDDSLMKLKVLLLVRDPRGTMQSRRHRIWCPGNPDCDDPKILCSDLVSDYHAAQELLRDFPLRFRVIRYEDFCQEATNSTDAILTFFDLLNKHPDIAEYVRTHTGFNKGGVSSTYRDIRTAPYHWKQELLFENVAAIQDSCREAMMLWGYRIFYSQDQLDTLDSVLPLSMNN